MLRLYAQKLMDLVDILNEQHQAGRRLTDRILSTPQSLKTREARQKLAHNLRACVRMHEPHVAREDTVLFPALRVIVTPQEYKALGEKFEEIEHKTFGADGFDIYLDPVTAFEKRLGVYDLAPASSMEQNPQFENLVRKRDVQPRREHDVVFLGVGRWI